MDANSNDNYVLVLEDRSEVKNEQEVGKLSVVSSIDEKGNLKTSEAKDAHQATFLKFNNKDGLLKNFMTNFLKQFNEPSRFGLYKVLATNVEQGVDNLRTALQNRNSPESQAQLQTQGVRFEDFLPVQKNATAIAPSQVDWRMLESLEPYFRNLLFSLPRPAPLCFLHQHLGRKRAKSSLQDTPPPSPMKRYILGGFCRNEWSRFCRELLLSASSSFKA